jgi:DNA-binding transcriptional ArsR family regulator
MVQYNVERLDRTFAALADPTRRAILGQLSRHSRLTAGELAAPFDMSLPAILKHVSVLRKAGLVEREKIGRAVHCRLSAAPMREAVEWLELHAKFWSERLDALADYLEGNEKK